MIEHKVISVMGGFPYAPVRNVERISGGGLNDEFLRFTTDPSIMQESKVLFGFKSSKTIPKSSVIELVLPYFRAVENVSAGMLKFNSKK